MPAHRNNFSPHTDPPPLIPFKQVWMQDIIWGRPVFKAPSLPNPRKIFNPLPFIADRITQPMNEEVQI